MQPKPSGVGRDPSTELRVDLSLPKVEGTGAGGARLRQGYGGSAVARRDWLASGGWRAPAQK